MSLEGEKEPAVCEHGLEAAQADDAGMTCDGSGCQGREVACGEPLLGCRECNRDYCLRCLGTDVAWKRREEIQLRWGEAHHLAASIGAWEPSSPEEKEESASRDAFGWSPAHWACWSGDLKGQVASNGSAVAAVAPDNLGVTPVMLACRHANAERAAAIINSLDDARETALSTLDKQGRSSLVYAVQGSHAATVRAIARLLPREIFVTLADKLDEAGLTALHHAVVEGHYAAASELVTGGADPNLSSAEGFSPLVLGVEQVSEEAGEAKEAALRFLKQLLEAGADTEGSGMPGNENISPLLMATTQGDLQVTKLLLEHGANLDTVSNGLSVLHMAAKSGKVDVLRAILEQLTLSVGDVAKRKAFVNKTTPEEVGGYSALHYAIEAGKEDAQCAVELLIAHGADVGLAAQPEGMTPLHLAALFCSEKTCAVLLDAGADATVVDAEGDTPLHNAAGKQENGEDRVPIAQLLLTRGAELEHANHKGFTPLAAAAAAENRPVAAELVNRGAKTVTFRVPENVARERAKRQRLE